VTSILDGKDLGSRPLLPPPSLEGRLECRTGLGRSRKRWRLGAIIIVTGEN